MKLAIIFFLLLPFYMAAQSIPVVWNAFAEKKGDSIYILTIEGQIQHDWLVYARDNTKDGLETIKVAWETEKIKGIEQLLEITLPVAIHDKIFNRIEKVWKHHLILKQKIVVNKPVPSSFKVIISAFAANDTSFIPLTVEKDILLEGASTVIQNRSLKVGSFNLEKPVSTCNGSISVQKGSSYFAIFLLGVMGGLIALLTPCVFPMIPVTVSFFTGKALTKAQAIRQGLLYGFFITLIYLLASVPFHIAVNIQPEIFNTLATNAWVNIFFFIVFIFFALSFFGLFEITLPSSITNATGIKSGFGSIAGIFFMALTLATVSFSCTGPILGSLLVGSLSSGNGAWQLTAGMCGFGLSLAFPFAFLAIFPQWMKKLPKSGGWLNTTKKVLAFIELALALKFLSNADLVGKWGILKREVFIGIWIIITICLSFYLFDVSSFKRSAKTISHLRIIFGSIVLLFALYMLPGVTNSRFSSLKLLSGFPPPLNYSFYERPKDEESGLALAVVNDYEKALKIAKQQGKPLLIDFTGWACVNCRKMEELVWTKKEIRDIIDDKYILVSLYVDDRTKLPADSRFIYKNNDGTQKEIRTQGDKWSTFQSENFQNVSQPFYVLVSPDEKLLNQPVGYTPDEKEYRQWLECGFDAFNQIK